MVRSRKTNRKSALKNNQRQRRRRRNRASGSSNTRQRSAQSFGPLVGKGIRSVLGALPGAGITTAIADFIFKAMGWTDERFTPTISAAIDLNSVMVTGLAGAFELDATAFLGSIQGCGLISPLGYGNPDLAAIQTQWRTSRISVIKVIGRPSGPSGTVSGSWGIGLIPFRTSESASNLAQEIRQSGVTFEMVRQCPVYQMADANKPLVIRHYFTPADGFSYQPQINGTSICAVIIAYQDLMRGTYTSLTAADFQCTIDCSATVILTDRAIGLPPVAVDNRVAEIAPDAQYIVRSKEGMLSLKDYKCTNNNGKCKVGGTVTSWKQFPSTVTLDSMII